MISAGVSNVIPFGAASDLRRMLGVAGGAALGDDAAICANGTLGVPATDSLCGRIRIASTAIARAALAGIHQTVRPM